ncbi:SIR2 family NAD-dependent protein deacylase [Tumebacillus algifaecis]|nr:SIR2 family protein [Tumebacillus algifaecis]
MLAEYYVLKKGKEELQNLLDVFRKPLEEMRAGEVHELLVQLQFPIIYTTNYDHLLEKAHEKFTGEKTPSIVTLNDMLKVGNNMKVQIVKFHGDLDDLDSVVLDETSYFERMDFEAALDIKMRADMLGRSVLFLGYSLGDFNVRYMMYKLHKLWDSAKDPLAKPKSYIFLTTPNPLLKEVLFEKRGITTFTSEVSDHGEGLKRFLQALLKGVNDLEPQ